MKDLLKALLKKEVTLKVLHVPVGQQCLGVAYSGVLSERNGIYCVKGTKTFNKMPVAMECCFEIESVTGIQCTAPEVCISVRKDK